MQHSSQSLLVFSEAWAERLAEEVNSDSAYSEAAGDWSGVLALALDPVSGATRQAVLELEAGRCKKTCTDLEECPPDYVICGDERAWRAVLAGDVEPIWGLMSGKLRLTQGRLTELVPQAEAAGRLVECARQIPTHFDAESSDEPVPATDTT